MLFTLLDHDRSVPYTDIACSIYTYTHF